MSEFKIGDRVEYIGKSYEIELGELGTVLYICELESDIYEISDSYEIGVEWDKETKNRHDGLPDYKGRRNHCWNIWSGDIRKVETKEQTNE